MDSPKSSQQAPEWAFPHSPQRTRKPRQSGIQRLPLRLPPGRVWASCRSRILSDASAGSSLSTTRRRRRPNTNCRVGPRDYPEHATTTPRPRPSGPVFVVQRHPTFRLVRGGVLRVSEHDEDANAGWHRRCDMPPIADRHGRGRTLCGRSAWPHAHAMRQIRMAACARYAADPHGRMRTLCGRSAWPHAHAMRQIRMAACARYAADPHGRMRTLCGRSAWPHAHAMRQIRMAACARYAADPHGRMRTLCGRSAWPHAHAMRQIRMAACARYAADPCGCCGSLNAT